MSSLNEEILAYEANQSTAADVLDRLEREYLYVPFEIVSLGNSKAELPVTIKLSDESRCIAVFSSDTVIDKKFYNKYTWKRMGYLELEPFVLGQSVKRNVIVDAFSQHPFMLKLETIERIAEARKQAQTGEDASLDTDVTGFTEAIKKSCIVFPTIKSIRRVWALTYKEPRKPDALCFVADLTDVENPDQEFQSIFQILYKVIGPAIPFLLLPYSDVRNEIKALKAERCFAREKK